MPYEEKTDYKYVESKKCSKKNLIVRFIDEEIIEGASCADTIKRFTKKVGVEEIARKNITWHGNPIIKTFNEDNREKVGDFRFILSPKMWRRRLDYYLILPECFRINVKF